MPRDNFTANTARIMAERVAYLCSNPNCRTVTIGPNLHVDKSTKIGEAAHICAASVGGPRYDALMTRASRTHMENGIWLCSNCSDLIDKDEKQYPVSLLKKWKADAEYEAYQKISGQAAGNKAISVPPLFLEADLKYYSSGRRNIDFSNKNPVVQDEDGNWVMPIKFDGSTIVIWSLDWEYSLEIYNNSGETAHNIKITQLSDQKFYRLESPDNINVIKPYDKLNLEAIFKIGRFEGTSPEADSKLAPRIPDELNGLTLLLEYQDSKRQNYQNTIVIKGQEILTWEN